MNWKRKAAAFRALSIMPGGGVIHYWLQRHVTGRLPRRPTELDRSLDEMRNVVRAFERWSSTPFCKSRVLEFGAGRDLANAVALSHAGAHEIVALDVERLAKLDLVLHVVRHTAARSQQPPPTVRNWSDLQRELRISYRAPADARDTRLPEHSIDLVFSWDTLEHLPADDIARILAETRRVLKPGGITISKIDYGDHFSTFDGGITPFNFLRYSEADWRPYNSRFQYQNRFRHSQYLAHYRDSGLTILDVRVERRAPVPEILETMAEEFRRFAPEDLFTLGALVIARSGPEGQ